MKLRNKLVAVLAASMVVTSVPVVTMADTNNYVSTSRYAQKGTTYGYQIGTYAGYDVVFGQLGGIGVDSPVGGYDYKYSNGFEFAPTNDYQQTDATFMSLTSDSEFNTKAILTYVDAFNSKSGVSYLAFDKNGKVVNANNPAYNGKTADDLLKTGVTMYYTNNGTTNATPSAIAATFPTSNVDAATLENKINDVFNGKVTAAGTALYTAAIPNADLLTLIKADIKAKLLAAPNFSVSFADVKAIVDEIVVRTEANNKEITTSYSQLYKTSNGQQLINSTKLAEIINETVTEVATWAKSELPGGVNDYENAIKAVHGTNAPKLTIQKVDVINYKDANDREYKSHIKVVSEGKFVKGVTYKVPILAKLGGDKVVILDVNGKDSNISSGKYNLTQDALTDKRLTIAADSKKLRTNYADEIGEIKFTESQINSLSKDGKNRKIKIELPTSSDLEFNINKTVANAKVTGKRGLFNLATTPANNVRVDKATNMGTTNNADRLTISYGVESRRNDYTDNDTTTLIIELPNWSNATAVGELVLTGIYVQPKDDVAAAGDVNATISEYLGLNEISSNLVASTTVKVAEVKDYDVSLTCEKPVDIKAGRSGIVNDKKTTFVLEEAVKDSLVDGRKIKFTIENGYIFGPADVDYSTLAANSNVFNSTGLYGTTAYKERAVAKFKELIANEKIKFEEKAGKDGDKLGFDQSTLSLEIDSEGRVIGFSGEYPRLSPNDADKIKVTMPIATDVMSKGEVKIKAENLYTRSFQDKNEDPSCVIANVIEPIAVTFDGAKLKVGKQAQEAGSITIKETDKGMLNKDWLFLAAKDQDGITFDTVPTVTVEGTEGKTLLVKNVALSKDKKILGLEITRTSTEASAIKISDIKLTSDRTVPEANYDLAIWGEALTDENELGITNFTQNALYNNAYFNQTSDLYIVKDFIQMTTVNTEDLSNSAKAATASFKIGENSFTVNGETVSMGNATAYIKDNLTFVPVRYVAQAFGITGNAVQFDAASGTATIVAGDKVINITNGKAYLTVNGTNVPMQTKAEIKDGRMCVPMAYIANALGVDKSWDAATKTATFTNVR